MKSLSNYLNEKLVIIPSQVNEKLVINKDYTNIAGLEELFDNIKFKHVNNYELETSNDIFSIMVDYIHNHNIRSFSDFDSYRNRSREDSHPYIVVFNKRIKEIDIFQKISNDTYKVFIIFKHYSDYKFEKVELGVTSMHALNKSNTWDNAVDVEYYEISKEIFNDVSELYNKLIKK